ncbi:MAG: hypothetical protein R2744_03220 [Bacteroidales bacterium]
MFDQDDEYLSGNSVPVTVIHMMLQMRLQATSLDRNRNIMNNPNNGVAITEYAYDEKGNRTETLRFDMDP